MSCEQLASPFSPAANGHELLITNSPHLCKLRVTMGMHLHKLLIDVGARLCELLISTLCALLCTAHP